MPSSGTIYGTTLSPGNPGLTYKMDWEVADSGINESGTPYSIVDFKFYTNRPSTQYVTTDPSADYEFYIDSVLQNSGEMYYTVANDPINEWVMFDYYTKTILHNADGTKTFSVYYDLDLSGTSAVYARFSGSITLTEVPPIGLISFDRSSINLTTTYVNLVPTLTNILADKYYHLIMKIGNTIIANETFVSTDTVRLTLRANIVGPAMPTSQNATAVAALTTYADSARTQQIGIPSTATINVVFRSKQANTATFSATYGGQAASVGIAYPIQGYSTAITTITGDITTNGNYGAEIVSVSYYVGKDLIETKTTDIFNWTSPVLQTSGSVDIKAELTDARGNSFVKPILAVVLPYAYPQITAYAAGRADPFGNYNKEGECIKVSGVTAVGTPSGINPITSVMGETYDSNGTLLASHSVSSDYTFITPGYSKASQFYVLIKATDLIGNTATVRVDIPTSTRIINVLATKNGLAFGKFAETPNLFECEYPAQFNNGITMGSTSLSEQQLIDLLNLLS